MLFLLNEGLIVPLTGKKGLGPKVKKFLASRRGGWRRWKKPNYGYIIRQLRDLNLLPAIFFLKSRADCDRAIFTCLPSNIDPRVNTSLKQATNAFLRNFPHLEGHRQMVPLLKSRVGSHHGGQLPYWKALIEKMMSKGYLEAIFSTSTVAAGVNFPARTVVLVQSDRYNGREFADLTATDFHQMVGRAGRRGKDRIGFGVVIPGLHQDPKLLSELNNAPPEPLLSQLHINFSMTLNLLLSHTPLEVRDLIDLSFASFQERETEAYELKSLGIQMEGMGGGLWLSFKRHVRFLQETGFVDQANRLTPDGHWASKLRLDQPLLIAEAIRRGALNRVSPEIMAGGLAPFVWDRPLELKPLVDGVYNLTEIKEHFNKIIDHIENLKELKQKRGFESSPILFWPAAALFMWARMVPWERLLTYVNVDEGDMASLIMRTADHLRQVTNLKETHPQLASVAENALKLILRQPVYID
jgi:superfamily II RNA helicase